MSGGEQRWVGVIQIKIHDRFSDDHSTENALATPTWYLSRSFE